jgi:hypothetical protein
LQGDGGGHARQTTADHHHALLRHLAATLPNYLDLAARQAIRTLANAESETRWCSTRSGSAAIFANKLW